MEDRMLTIKEVAYTLGLSEITIRQWIQHGKIESVKLSTGRSRRIPKSEVDRIKNGKKGE